MLASEIFDSCYHQAPWTVLSTVNRAECSSYHQKFVCFSREHICRDVPGPIEVSCKLVNRKIKLE